jgi:stage II sporulation protein R
MKISDFHAQSLQALMKGMVNKMSVLKDILQSKKIKDLRNLHRCKTIENQTQILTKDLLEAKSSCIVKQTSDNRFYQELHIQSPVSSDTKVKHNRFQLKLLLFILFFCGAAMWLVKTNSVNNATLQTGIAGEIIRFHVIANSDSEKDQALKLIVKNTLVENLSPYLREVATVAEARTILSDRLTYIQDLAEATLVENGCNDAVRVSLEECYFPLKVYGNYTFPPGNYEALRVCIGKAEGKNWWCVMFPPLCFVDETYCIVDETSQEKLKHLLTEEEYDILVSQKTPVKIKFKLLDALKNLFE